MKSIVFAWVCLFFSPIAQADAQTDYFRAISVDNESAVIELALFNFDLNVLNEKGEHALHVALAQGSHRVAAFLLKQRILKVDLPNQQGETPLMLAAIKGELDIARQLIARGAAVNKPGWTPLHYATSNPDPGSAQMVSLMLEHHAYIDAASPNKTTPLMMAAFYGSEDAARLLLEEGADASLRNDLGMTAIDFALKAERSGLAEALANAMKGAQPIKGRW
ncbi:ankyrin repeat domain-containing protein [Hydrogenophaga sp. 5NK40-0174]|uniref:ankyrin repeat domain-containing protein n=1 Tax=Hydrogenophaga sp. 5NK40-0174 TaxID=3127649 RepID=UPI003341F172